jgi:hypothetical protein
VVEAPSINNVTQPLAKFSPYVGFINGCYAAATTYSAASMPGTISNIDGTANGITGSIVGSCQNLVSDSSLTALGMQPSYPNYVLTNPTAAAVTAIGSNGSDFQIYYEEP